MNVYNFDDYRKFFAQRVKSARASGSSLTFAKIADQMGVQRSYFSQVLNGRGNLTADQLFLAGKACALAEEDIEFLVLLLEIERCSVKERKSKLVQQREQLRAKSLRTESFVSLDSVRPANDSYNIYYSDPYCPIVHMCLTVPKFREDIRHISSRLGISMARLEAALAVLSQCRIISRSIRGIELHDNRMYLPGDSPLAVAHGTMLRLFAINQRQKVADPDDYFFTTTFSATESVRKDLHLAFLNVFKSFAPLIEKAPSEEVFHVNFDLFRI